MPLITTAIPNLIGGVSQQPPAIRNSNEAEAMENAVPSPVEGMMKRPPTEHLFAVANASGTLRTCSTSQRPFIHMIERDESERYILSIQQDGTLDVYDFAGNRKTLFTIDALASASATQRKALTVGDVTFISNAATTVAQNTSTATPQIPTNYNRACLVWIRQANYNREHRIKLTSGSPATTQTFVHAATSSGDIGTDHVAAALLNGTGGQYSGPSGGIFGQATYNTSLMVDGVIYIKGSADFTVVLEDDFAGEGMTFIRDVVDRFEDLPPTAPHGYIVKVAGVPESNVDDYHVKFVADNGTFSRGVWQECPAPNVRYQWNTTTLPYILIRQSDGTFMLKKADGTTPSVVNGRPSGDSATVYNGYAWGERTVGSDDNNPYPSFLGFKIQDMVYHQNRLGFLSGENIIFSETSEFFNFFRTTTLDILDTDPIDIASSSPRIGKIMAAIPFNRDLILFTPNSQMVLRGGDVLSPKSVAMIPAADFENQSFTVKPCPSANSVFFTYSNGGFVGMRELIPQPSIDGSYLANDLTNNVSRYIPGTPTHLTATTHDNMAFIVAGGSLYGYRYFLSNNQRVQSAWFKHTFANSLGGSGDFATAIWAEFIESDLYVAFLRRATNSTTAFITVEKMRMGAGVNDSAISGKNWITNLDQRKYYAAGQGTYNSGTGRTTFTLAKPLSYGNVQVVTLDGYVLSVVAGTNYSEPTAATVSVAGDWSAKAVWIGVPYTMTYEFSTPYLKGAAGRGNASILTGRLQLRYLTLQYADSGYFRITVAVDGGDTYTYPFTGDILGVAVIGSTTNPSGTFRVPVYSKNETSTVKILNDSHLPSKILSGELEAYYNDRAQRYSA